MLFSFSSISRQAVEVNRLDESVMADLLMHTHNMIGSASQIADLIHREQIECDGRGFVIGVPVIAFFICGIFGKHGDGGGLGMVCHRLLLSLSRENSCFLYL